MHFQFLSCEKHTATVELQFSKTDIYNSQGCTKSFHNSEKPPEAERPPVNKSKSDEVIEYKAPQAPVFESLERPPFESPMVSITEVQEERFRHQPNVDQHACFENYFQFFKFALTFNICFTYFYFVHS